MGLSNFTVMLPPKRPDGSPVKGPLESAFLTKAMPLGLDMVIGSVKRNYERLPPDHPAMVCLEECLKLKGFDVLMRVREFYYELSDAVSASGLLRNRKRLTTITEIASVVLPTPHSYCPLSHYHYRCPTPPRLCRPTLKSPAARRCCRSRRSRPNWASATKTWNTTARTRPRSRSTCIAGWPTSPTGKLILVTAITPTPAGEGKTTTSIGLCDGLNRIGKQTTVCLREPSLGPCFGMKGGAAGGGYAQVVPMEDINLHFTGDFHAIELAHNLLAAMLDNHIHHGNALGIDPRRIVWRRVVDMNDRALRDIIVGLGGVNNSVPHESGFDITVASEVMAVFCLSESLQEMKERLGRIIVGYTREQKPITAADLKAHGAMTALLKHAIKPNLVQTLENNPALIHGGPFANIAHGCNSILATKLSMWLSEYTVTEAGFGADLGRRSSSTSSAARPASGPTRW